MPLFGWLHRCVTFGNTKKRKHWCRCMAKRSKRRARKRGRPATGRDPGITVRLTPRLQRALALLVERHGITRSGAIRCLLNAGIDHSYWMIDPKRNVAYEGDTP